MHAQMQQARCFFFYGLLLDIIRPHEQWGWSEWVSFFFPSFFYLAAPGSFPEPRCCCSSSTHLVMRSGFNKPGRCLARQTSTTVRETIGHAILQHNQFTVEQRGRARKSEGGEGAGT